VLADVREALEQKYRLKGLGYDFGSIVSRVSRIFGISEARLKASGKEPERVKAKSVAAFWAVRELGVPGTEVGKELCLTQSAVSRAVRRGEEIISELGLCISDERNA
jgi:hypothetical protein